MEHIDIGTAFDTQHITTIFGLHVVFGGEIFERDLDALNRRQIFYFAVQDKRQILG